MIKKRYFSLNNDLKTGFFYKIFLSIGIILVLIYIFFKLVILFFDEKSLGFAKQLYNFSQTSYPDSILAFSIIMLAISVIFYFFYCQFLKLSKIADDIEKEEESNDLNDD
ncbi:MAG: hypothetical protein QHH15_03135 [Candidatus Thermoplasmatota archaeon]|jgi:amino acid transporter|nr:hypothetical protein [Candidatus Thermoplasmatota archaeon]